MNKNITAILILIVAGVAVPFFILPLWDEVSIVRGQKAALDEAIENTEKFVSLRNTLTARLEEFTPTQQARVNALLPTTLDEVQIMLDLQQLALRNGMSLSSITPSEDIESGGGGALYGTLAIEMSLSGTYAELENFLMELSESLMLFEVTSLGFGRPDETTRISEFSITVETYQYNG